MPILGICKWTLLVRHRDGGIYQWIEAFNRRGAWNRKGMRFGDVEGKRMSERYEIRPINPKSIWAMNLCSSWGGLCHEMATYYLVRKPDKNNFEFAESRSRRCAHCAQREAKLLKIPFPATPKESTDAD